MANNPTLEAILRQAGSAWSFGAVPQEYQPQMRPIDAPANAEITQTFNIVAYSTPQAKHAKSALGPSVLVNAVTVDVESWYDILPVMRLP